MKYIKTKNEHDTYDIELIDKDKKLSITLANDGDLYMSITNEKGLTSYANDYRFIDIEKYNNEEIYNAFDNLYNDIILKSETIENDIVDNYKSITWFSDGEEKDLEDALIIYKKEDYYRLIFFRNNINENNYIKIKDSKSINIRFSTRESKNKEFLSSFINMYNELKDIEKQKVYKKGD